MAGPIALANTAAPLLGLADTAVIGNRGSTSDLGAVALGALVFSFAYWTFGFLRMGTTGFTAQAAGAGESAEVRAVLARALGIAGALGVALLVLQSPLRALAFSLLSGSESVEQTASLYFELRIWGAPAALGGFAIAGVFVGLGLSGRLLAQQVVLNGVNIALDCWLAGVLDWGVRGIAIGTALSEWIALGFALALLRPVLLAQRADAEPLLPWLRLRAWGGWAVLLRANADIMVRTWLLLFGFAWFTDRSARLGDAVLAANHVLLQFVSFSAFFLDGLAFATESVVGRAIGARQRAVFDATLWRTGQLSAAIALALALAILAFGGAGIALLTDLEAVRSAAHGALPLAALYVLVACAAFQLDGVFIGATRTRSMRNASLESVALFLLAAYCARPAGNAGLWAAFIAYVIARAVTLGLRLPALRRAVPWLPAGSDAARAGHPTRAPSGVR